MTAQKRTISILNLTSELSEGLSSYFMRNSIALHNPADADSSKDFTHILCRGQVDYDLIAKTYDTISKDIKIISLSGVSDTQEFVWANGKLVFDEKWLTTPVGEFILDKFFLEFGGIEIKDSYPKFQELGKFNIINPFNSGEYADVMVYEAYQQEFNGLLIKTYFDHLLMYLISLKNKNKAGIPFEVSYGYYEGVFALQVHFVITDVVLSDISSCLSDVLSDQPLENVLNIALGSTSFFEFTYLNQVKKAVLTAFWLNADYKLEHRGLMFTDIDSSGSFLSLPVHESPSWLVKSPVVEDISAKVGVVTSGDEGVRIKGKDLNEIVAEKVSGGMELEKVKQIINGDIDEQEIGQLIEGLKEELTAPVVVRGSGEDDEKIKISSKEKYDDVVNIVKGKIEEEKGSFVVKGGEKVDINNFAMKISSGLSNTLKGDDKLKSKLLGQKLPDKIKSSFLNFAKNLNKSPDEMSANELDLFKENIIPEILEEVVQLDENPTLAFLSSSGATEIKNFFKDFKDELSEGIANQFQNQNVEDALAHVDSEQDVVKVKDLVKNSLQKSLKEHFHLEQKNDVTKEDEVLIVKTLSTTLKEDESKVQQIFSKTKDELDQEKKNNETLLFKDSAIPKDPKIEEKLRAAEHDNQQLRKQMDYLRNELKNTKDVLLKVQNISNTAMNEVKPQIEKMVEVNSNESRLKDVLIKQIEHSQQLTKEEAVKLSELHDKEKKLIHDIKDQEIAFKKLQLESSQKEAFYMQELEKIQRTMRAKDLVLEKAKDSISTIVGRKDQEIQDLKHRLDQMSKAIANQQGQNNIHQMKDMERKNANLEKMLDVYKNKIQSLAANINRHTGKESDGRYVEENRKLTMIKNQLTNQVDSMKRELKRFEEKANNDQVTIVQLRKDTSKLLEELKDKDKALQSMASQASAVGSATTERKVDYAVYIELQQQFETKTKDLETRLKDTESKLAEALKVASSKSTPLEDSKGKSYQMEQSLKHLTQEVVTQKTALNESKKEANKLRNEKTALQNQLDKLKKDMEKLRGSAKKAG